MENIIEASFFLLESFARGKPFSLCQRKDVSPPYPPPLQSRHGCQRLVAAEAAREAATAWTAVALRKHSFKHFSNKMSFYLPPALFN